MSCACCEKKLNGGFKQDDGTFRCAHCVLHNIRYDSFEFVLLKIRDALKEELKRKRPTKRGVNNALNWANAKLTLEGCDK